MNERWWPRGYGFYAPHWAWCDIGWGPRKKHAYIPIEEIPNPPSGYYDPEDDPLVSIVQEALDRLTDKQRYVVCRYFGISCPKSTEQEIANTMGIGRHKVCELKHRAFGRLRNGTILPTICRGG